MTEDTTDRRWPGRAAGPRLRRPAALLGAAALVAATVTAVTVSTAAQAADTPRTGLGKDGQKLTVSASANLDPDGETLKVTGSGYDATKAIYVALCRDNGDGKIPTPCIGGADENGTGNSSQWIVPEGDEYAGDLALKWGAGGTFDVEIAVKAKDNGVDCTQVVCSVVTRVDHRNSGDRSQDVRVPVTFEGQDTGDGDGDGVDVPAGTVSYVESAAFSAAGEVKDLLLHPESGKLYAGSEDFVDTGDVNERGLHALDAANGRSLSHISQAPGSNGALGPRNVSMIAAPLAGDGVVFHYPLRGIGTAKDGDTAATGTWLAGSTVTGVGPGTKGSTVLVAQGAQLSEVDLATGVPLENRTLTLEGASLLGVDKAHGAAWSAGPDGGPLRRVDTGTFTVTATAELPAASVGFVEADPATGNVWVGSGNSVRVYDKDAKLLKTVDGPDEAVDIAFDTTTGRAFVVRQDNGDSGDGGDNTSHLGVYDTATYAEAATSTKLADNNSQVGEASVAVAPGGTTVYVSSPFEGEITKLDCRMSPKVTQSPTDRTVAPGDEVSFVAAAEGTPEPSVAWEVSVNGGQTWSAVEGATKNTYSFTAKAAHDGYEYRAVFTNSVGVTRTSPFTLTVTEADDSTGGGDGEDTEPSGTKTVTGSDGQKLTVTPVNNLATEKQTLKVTGSGYDEEKGIYVALCVDNGDGELPTPCVGGVDMTGASHSSAWISSNPPDYGEELATPYEDGGTFEVELTIDAKDEYTDCFKATCVLATRADHTLSGDRSQDVKVPVAFVGQDPVDTDDGDGDSDGGTSTGGSSGSGSTSSGSSTSGSTGSTGGSTTGDDGSLASTGLTVLGVAASAVALTVTGWILHRRARGMGRGTAS
ncbi:immunoglobulin domain-containing protein [Streptomyces sp. DSM 40750]|uniref:immunoglobulin domain-containing protein n=1 Tax=Streptomyces sp. DSM 40750 TaxID=2801030 RepID=UPI00214C5007|nr:immunoglobulin domain-containing protein [Streptomyces sp. DSM 40750]UUU20074.1 immunoglobulin domain-containing protein [Streptomyces sp. DSM 40750]